MSEARARGKIREIVKRNGINEEMLTIYAGYGTGKDMLGVDFASRDVNALYNAIIEIADEVGLAEKLISVSLDVRVKHD